LKILVIDTSARKGGALSILKDFLKYIDQNDNGINWVFVISTRDIIAHNKNIEIITSKFPVLNWLFRILWEMFAVPFLISRKEIDIVISLQNTAMFITRKPVVLYVHQSLPFTEEKVKLPLRKMFKITFLRFFIGKSARRSEKVIVQTEWMKNALVRTYSISDKQVVVIPPSVGRLVCKKTDVSNDCFKFFYPAGASSYKNFKVIIKAAEILKKEGCTKFKIYLTIKGNENRYAAHIKNEILVKGLGDSLKLVGYIERAKVLNMYCSCILVYPSLIESFPLPLLEARMLGSVVISSDKPFAREILYNYQKGFFFNPYSPEDLAQKMKYVMDNFSKINEIGFREEDFERYSEKETWGKIVRLLNNIGSRFK